ncbi:MAG: hypothetical protein ABI609_12545 [Acidobacteriota bacterium]
MRARLRGAFQTEDWILFAWLAFMQQVLHHWLGGPLRAFATGVGTPRWALLATGLCFAVVFYTRGPEDVDVPSASSRRCVLSVVLFFAAERYLAGESSWFALVGAWAVLVVAAMAPIQQLESLPYTGLGLRRVLVMPAILLGNTVFVTQIGPRFLADPSFEVLDPALRLPAKVGLAGLLFLYTVVGPRVMAGGPWNPLFWTLRFAWYLVAQRLSGFHLP